MGDQGTRPINVLELRSVRGTGGGPEKTILAGAAQSDPSRYRVTVCYIRDRRDDVFAIDRRADGTAIDYVEVRESHSIDPAIWPQLRRLVRDRAIDIVHAHEYKTDLIALLLGRFERVIPLATAHGWTGHSWRERHIYYPADRRLLARFPAVVAVSDQIRGEIVAAGAKPERVTTILNGIDPGLFRRDRSRETAARQAIGFRPGDLVIGAVGRLEPQKRFDLLIEAFGRLQPRWPSLRLVIAGDGSLRAALQAQAESSLVPGTWRLAGHCDDVIALHHGLDILVQSSDYEGTPNAVLEAMALETAIVATTAGGTAQLARDGVDGWLLEPGDARSLEASMERALGDPDGRAAMVRSARRRVEDELSFARRMRRLEAIYDALAERRGRPAGEKAWQGA